MKKEVEVMDILVRYSEIGLKGKNRGNFENRLVDNLRSCLRDIKADFKIILRPRGRIIIRGVLEAEVVVRKLTRIFGIISLSPAFRIETNFNKISQKALEIYGSKIPKTFRITTQRLNKEFEYNSHELNCEVGGVIFDKYKKAKVSLEKPDLDIGIEIISDEAYLFTERIEGLGGLPVATQGVVRLDFKTKEDLVAGFLMFKRGCSIYSVGKIPSLIKNFSYGNTFSSNTLKSKVVANINSGDIEKLCKCDTLFPLIGYTKKEINKIYKLMEKI